MNLPEPRNIVVTGASEGIGYHVVSHMSNACYYSNIILCAITD